MQQTSSGKIDDNGMVLNGSLARIHHDDAVGQHLLLVGSMKRHNFFAPVQLVRKTYG